MRNISNKVSTLRIAKASAKVFVLPEIIELVRKNETPKPDALIVARTASLASIKKTADLIPYCHPITIEGADIELTLGDDHIAISATVTTLGKTGVEMEALTATTVAALNIYDLLKPLNKEMIISEVKLDSKVGGKSDYRDSDFSHLNVHILTTSHGVAQGVKDNRAGRAVVDKFFDLGISTTHEIIDGDQSVVQGALLDAVGRKTSLVVTIGGTGLNEYDETVEATRQVIAKELPGITYRMQQFGQSRTPSAMISRGIGGFVDKTLIINLPGSHAGAIESFDALFPYLLYQSPLKKKPVGGTVSFNARENDNALC